MPDATRQHRTASERDAPARARTADMLALIDACLAAGPQTSPGSTPPPTRHNHEVDR